jgi:hypothetical protein
MMKTWGRRLAALAAVTIVLLAARAATALEGDDLPRLDERTARTVGARTLKLGVLAFDYGIIEKLSVGTDPPAWAARAFISVLIPNLHLKGIVFERDPVQVAVEVAGYYGQLVSEGSASGHIVVVPVSLFASVRLHDRWFLHGEGAYNFAKAYGTGDLNNGDLNGNVATRTFQLGAMLEYRLRDHIALTAVGRYQAYSGPLAFGGTAMLDPYTSVTLNGQATPRVAHPWTAIAGVAFLWSRVHLSLGVGYGYYFIPGMNIAYPKQTVVPDASLAILL